MFFRTKTNRKSPRRRLMVLENLDKRCYLAADVTFTINASNFLTVNGSDFDDIITVYDDGSSVKIYAEYNGNGGVILDTGAALGTLSGVKVLGRLGGDTISIDSTMGSISAQLSGNDGDDILNGGLGKNTLRGHAGVDELYGSISNDSLQFDQDDTVLSGAGGQDTATAIDATAGLSLVVDSGWALEKIIGSGFDDVIDGSAATSRLDLTGLGGMDVLTGGSGNNTLIGGNGSDTIGYNAAPIGVSVSFDAGSASENGYGGTDSITDVEAVRGSAFDDLLVGSAANDEQLYGNGGNDTLIGLGGEDHMDGGAGVDTIDYSASAAAVNVNLGNAQTAEVGGDAQGDTVFAVENVIGTAFNDTLVGNGNANTLDGGDGDDSITGGSGDDTLIGGNGNDTLTGGAGTDSVDGGADNDTVFADSLDDQAATFTGGDGTDNLKAANSSLAVDWLLGNTSLFEVISGSSVGDIIDASALTLALGMTINGLSGADTLTGGAGDDTINGAGDADTIFGGTGADILRGGNGNDILYANDLANTNDGVRDRLFGDNDSDTGFGHNSGSPNNDLATSIETNNFV